MTVEQVIQYTRIWFCLSLFRRCPIIGLFKILKMVSPRKGSVKLQAYTLRMEFCMCLYVLCLKLVLYVWQVEEDGIADVLDTFRAVRIVT